MNAALQTIAPAEHDRRRYIGGSDVAAVLGISPWRTPLQLWEAKTREDDHTEPVGRYSGRQWVDSADIAEDLALARDARAQAMAQAMP